MNSQRRDTISTMNFRSLAFAASVLGAATLVTGCSGNIPSNFGVSDPTGQAVHITGTVYGGTNPVNGALVQLYTVGVSGNASASTGLISAAPVSGKNQTDGSGKFDISGLYNGCTGSTQGTLVYIVATGGNPGGYTTNSDIALVAALGDCATLYNNAATTHILLNEATTVAAAFSLAPFATDLTHIGASGVEPVGLVNAFANASVLVNTATGTANGINAGTGVQGPASTVNQLADILVSCVNSSGGSSGDGSACGTLFAATGVTTNIFDAALRIAKNPGAATITALYSLAPQNAPFMPANMSRPNDFTLAVTYAGTGLNSPYGIAIDSSGNAWVTNESGSSITEFTPSGTAANYTAPGLVGAQGIAVDKLNNVWVANTAGNSIIKFPAGSVNSPVSFTAGGIAAPTAIATDSQNNVWVTNFNGNSVTELSTAGAALNSSPLLANGNLTVPSGITIGSAATSGAVYVTGGSGGVVKLINSTGAYSTTLTDNALQGPLAAATDPLSGNILAVGYTTGSSIKGALSEFATDAPVAGSPVALSGSLTPTGVASDGVSIWVPGTSTGSSYGLMRFTFASATPSSPANGFAPGLLSTSAGVAVDSSGSLWVANAGNNNVLKFIGLSAAVPTPLAFNVGP